MLSKRTTISALLLIAVLCTYGCLRTLKRTPPVVWTLENSLVQTSPPELSDDRDVFTLINALDQSLRYYDKLPSSATARFGTEVVTVQELRSSVAEFRDKVRLFGLTQGLFDYVKEHFIFFKTGATSALITGYYEAKLKGSRTKTAEYRFPLYAKPNDLVSRGPATTKLTAGRLTDNGTVVPYYTRREIDFEGKLEGKGLELLWIDNLIDVVFLQIQGSGIVTLPDGKTVRVNFADRNGHGYRPIGKYLIDRGYLTKEEVSMQTIRAFLSDHPDLHEEVFSYDPSYVFFRIVEEGPIGSIGVPLTPYRSIAVDQSLFPRGLTVVLQSDKPIFAHDGSVERWERFTRFVVSQDTGGAIRGADHIDLFTGYGRESEQTAGVMKGQGVFYFFRKKRPEEYSTAHSSAISER